MASGHLAAWFTTDAVSYLCGGIPIKCCHFTFFMARRYRKVRSRRRRSRRRFRRRSAAGKALRRVRSLSRKIAGEVKKLDVNAIIPEDAFT